MQTRSQPLYEKTLLFEVNIDFIEASNLWKANKKSIGNGSYKYICLHKCKSGKTCNKTCVMGEECCKMHLKK